MYIGKVSGTVVATFKDKVFEGKKLLIVDRLTPEGEPTGHYWIAVDDVQAGLGDTVMVIDEGNSARQVVDMDPAPIRAVVVGIVDEIDINDKCNIVKSDETGTEHPQKPWTNIWTNSSPTS